MRRYVKGLNILKNKVGIKNSGGRKTKNGEEEVWSLVIRFFLLKWLFRGGVLVILIFRF